MKTNWHAWKAGAAVRSARARRAAVARWDAVHAGMPVREERVIEVTIRDTHRMRTVIVARQIEGDEGQWSRWTIEGRPGRPVGLNGLARHVAAALV